MVTEFKKPAAITYSRPVDSPATVLTDPDGNKAVGVSTVGGAQALKVDVIQSVGGGGGGGGTSMPDKSSFTEGTTYFTPMGGVVNDAIVADPAEDQAAAARITPKRALHVNLRSVSGVELGTAGAPVRTDPTGTTPQPVTGTFFQATQPVSGPLTDTQLRATAVPTSATQLPAALVGGRLDENVGAWLGSTAPTVGSKTSANSVPVVIASDQGTLPTADVSTSTLNNGAETAVSNVAVQILAANANRKGVILQNTGSANIRLGAAGVAANTGFRLTTGMTFSFAIPFIPTNALFAIRETAMDSIVLAMEMT